MPLAQQLAEYISACFTGLWIECHEHDDALREIAQICREQNWRLAIWDIEQGLQIPGQANGQSADAGGSDPLAAIRSINALASADSSAVLVLANFHRFLSSPEIVQALARQITVGKQNRTFVVVLSPVVQLPVELEKLFVVIEHDLPSREQIEEIARGMATEEGELPDGAGTGPRAGRRRRADPLRGRERLFALPGPAPADRAGVDLGTEGRMLKKSGLLTLASGRRAVRRPGRPGLAQGVLPAGHAEPGQPRPAAAAQGSFVALAARLWQKPILQGPWQRNGPAHAGPRRGLASWAARRPDAKPTSARP